jgi:hypothetical protein
MRAMLSRLTPHLLALGVVVLGLSTTACKKPEYPKCKKDKHCNVDLDEKCVEGMCQNCKIDTDCNGKGPNGANWKCAEFRCQDPALIVATPDGIGKPVHADPRLLRRHGVHRGRLFGLHRHA